MVTKSPVSSGAGFLPGSGDWCGDSGMVTKSLAESGLAAPLLAEEDFFPNELSLPDGTFVWCCPSCLPVLPPAAPPELVVFLL